MFTNVFGNFLVTNNYISKEQLLEMVAEINETQVDPEEVLSNQVYYYDSNIRALINTY